MAILLTLLANPLIWIFTDDPTTHKLGVYALLFYLPSVPFISINTSISSMFQGLGERWRSVLYMLNNRLLVPLLFAWRLGRRFGDLGIYASFAVGEIFLTLFLMAELLIKLGMKKTIIPSGLLHAESEADLRLNIHDPDDPTRNIGLRIIFASADEVRYNSSMNLNNVFIRINRTPASSDTDCNRG